LRGEKILWTHKFTVEAKKGSIPSDLSGFTEGPWIQNSASPAYYSFQQFCALSDSVILLPGAPGYWSVLVCSSSVGSVLIS